MQIVSWNVNGLMACIDKKGFEPIQTENMWTPVKRLLNRRKKPKWGDWDGLYIEEEEL